MNLLNLNLEQYDAIVVGTGVSGGWAAKELCENGLKTLVLERGRMVKHIEDYPTMHMDPWDIRHGGASSQEVLKDYKFYIICANLLAMPWIFTGFAIFQSFILTSKNWGPFVIAQSFMVYSILSVLTLFITGFLIDKFTSRKLIIYMNIPLLIAVGVLFYFKHPISSFFFLGLMGISNGFANILGSSTWAEIYGVKYIGSIKALTSGLMVFSTAFGTGFFGILIDNSFSIEQIALVSGSYILISISLLFLVKNKLNPQYL